MCRIQPSTVVKSLTGGTTLTSYSYLLHPSAWGRRLHFSTAGQETHDGNQATSVSNNDVMLLLEIQLTIDRRFTGRTDGMKCTVELTPSYWRAIAVFGHHQVCFVGLTILLHCLLLNLTFWHTDSTLWWLQLSIVPCATTVMLMLVRSGVRLGLSSAILWHVCVGVIMWMHDIPLRSVREATSIIF